MDITTILGIIIGWVAMAITFTLEGGGLGELWNLPAFIVVFFGTIGAGLAGTSFSTLAKVPGVLKTAFLPPALDKNVVIEIMVEFAKIARRQGILALEEPVRQIRNKFMRNGMELVVDGTASESVREILETELYAMQQRHSVGRNLFGQLGGFSPTLGIIGTVMGLINMLAKLDQPGDMGHAIAVAFIATLYGVSFANLFYLPIAHKLKEVTDKEVEICEMVIEGVIAIQSGASPRIVEMRMNSFIPPSQRVERAGGSDSAETMQKAA